MEEKDWYESSIASVIIVKFMIEYDKFEKEVKKIFQEQIKQVEHKKKVSYIFTMDVPSAMNGESTMIIDLLNVQIIENITTMKCLNH